MSKYTTTEDSNQSSAELPQTQKLIGKTTMQSSTEFENSMNTTTTTTTTTTVAPSPKTTLSTTTKATTMADKTTISTTTTKALNVTVFQKDAIKDNSTSKIVRTTKAPKHTTPKTIWTAKIYKPTIKPMATNITTPVTESTTPKTTSSLLISTVRTTKFLRYTASPTQKFKNNAATLQRSNKSPAKSSAWKPVLITFAVLLCCGGVAWIAMGARGARGRAALAVLRGRTQNDPEVRYLHSDVDDE